MANTAYFQSVVLTLDPSTGAVVSCQVNVAYKDSTNPNLQGGISPFIDPSNSQVQALQSDAAALIASVKASNGIN
jgi:hypothetical protein